MPAGRPGPLADKLNHLFSTVKPLDGKGREYSNDFVAQQLTQAGVSISASYIWQLRKGKKANPSLEHIQALSRFFGVTVDYFTNDEVSAKINSQLDVLRGEQQAKLDRLSADPEAQVMAARAAELSPEGRKQVSELLKFIHQMELSNRRDGGEAGR
ncbi:helix-turn-helix domain-containing protein [Crossiella sp. SN42]|uniref:helix-turn-helix domain-containing protein n=1 Tax=Crossiella sp. SN42 TaxID=2944808 RepID=UPI00207C8028|nr:helix-turn-helix domain-containing protein [Crossiella sp. SN42]MCO1580464.1 helix-turn-helix domain-containing protein [Crossiella sp. SN42]